MYECEIKYALFSLMLHGKKSVIGPLIRNYFGTVDEISSLYVLWISIMA